MVRAVGLTWMGQPSASFAEVRDCFSGCFCVESFEDALVECAK